MAKLAHRIPMSQGSRTPVRSGAPSARQCAAAETMGEVVSYVFFSRGGKKHDIWYPSRKKHLHWKSKIIFKSALGGDILVGRGVYDMWVCLGLCCESTSKYCIKDHHRYVCFTVPWFLPGLGNGIRTSQTKAPLILDFCAFIQIFTFIFHNIPLILCV